MSNAFTPRGARAHALSLGALLTLAAPHALAETVQAEPLAPVTPASPAGVALEEVQVVFHVVVEKDGTVSSAVPVERSPAAAPDAYVDAARAALVAARFRPTERDGAPVRSRVEWVVVFGKPPGSAPSPRPPAAGAVATPSTESVPTDALQTVDVRGVNWSSPRGINDTRVQREQLDAAPHQQTTELLAAAPGFFVDHEDGEGLGNDVYLRGFDLDHGSGIEMRVDGVPINIPTHISGQGYADANFIIPEVVESVRVLEGPYDPRQGDAAIVGSAYFELGAAERGYQVKTSYGSFQQWRLLAVAAPRGESDDTFLAFSARHTDGFGARRAGESAAVNAGYGSDLGGGNRLKLIATAYGARSSLPGVVREDDVNAGRIGYYDTYPYFAENQSVQSLRSVLGAELSHAGSNGARFDIAPWVMWTDFRARQNYTGALETSQINPAVSGLGDLFETTNVETAGGVTAFARSPVLAVGRTGSLVVEPGTYVRYGQTRQTKSLLDPSSLAAWDRRIGAAVGTLDAGGYFDADLRLCRQLRIAGGVRADLLAVTVNDHLANVSPAAMAAPSTLPGAQRSTTGIAAGPRVTLEYNPLRELTFSSSYGEGFRSLAAERLTDGGVPYSKVRAAEVGVRVQDPRQRLVATAAAFSTWVENELVFVAEAGGLETENASVRRGIVASLLARPASLILVSSALSVTNAEFQTRAPGISHYVPNVPPILFRTDVTARGTLANLSGKPVVGSAVAGYTFLSGRHLSDTVIGPVTHALNVGGRVRRDWLELAFDVYNALGVRYADSADIYVSNFSVNPGQGPASVATHIQAAPPRSWLASLSIYF